MKRSAVIFDLDGTLTRPFLDFDVIRAEIGVTGPVLEAMAGMDAAARARAEAILTAYERQAAVAATLQDDAAAVIRTCRSTGHPVGILTRNARSTLTHVLSAHGLAADAFRTREDGHVKPSGLALLSLCNELNADPARSWMVGDYLFDILAGAAAGTRTVLMLGGRPQPDYADRADFVIHRLPQILDLVRINAPCRGTYP